MTTALVRDTEGAAWQLSTAWTFPSDAVPADRVEVVGSEGGVELEVGSHLRQYGASDGRVDLTKEPQDDPLRAELDCFVAAIRTGSAPDAVTLRDAAIRLGIAEAILTDLKR